MRQIPFRYTVSCIADREYYFSFRDIDVYKRQEYILGGRKLPPIAVAMSAQASDMSGWLLTGLPGLAYILYAGTSEAIWTAVGLALGTYLNWLFVARRLRKYTQVAGCLLYTSRYTYIYNSYFSGLCLSQISQERIF